MQTTLDSVDVARLLMAISEGQKHFALQRAQFSTRASDAQKAARAHDICVCFDLLYMLVASRGRSVIFPPDEKPAPVDMRDLRALSDAYLRLRSMIPGAFDTPTAPTQTQVWTTTENALNKLALRAATVVENTEE